MSRPVDVQRFLGLRCFDQDKWFLLYLGAVLDCDVPILEALFYTTIGWSVWPDHRCDEAATYILRWCKNYIESYQDIEMKWNAEESMFEGVTAEGSSITLSGKEEHAGDLFLCCIRYEIYERVTIGTHPWTNGYLCIEYLNEHTQYRNPNLVRFGQFDAIFDEVLTLLFIK